MQSKTGQYVGYFYPKQFQLHVLILIKVVIYFWSLERMSVWSVTLPGLMSLEIQVVISEFGINNMNAWIYPALYQQFRLLLMV